MISPRADERAAVAELLEGEWDSADQLAGAVIKKVFELIQARRTFVVAVPGADGGPSAAFGPYASEIDAGRAAAKFYAQTFGDAGVRPVFTPGDLGTEDAKDDGQKCSCGHPKGAHDHVKGRGWCWALGGSLKQGNKCGCKGFAVPEKKGSK